MKLHLCLVPALMFLDCSLTAARAEKSHTYSEAVQRACASDYRKHCAEYGIETEALRLCMDKAGRTLSQNCVDALISAGEISKSEFERRTSAGH